MTSIWYYFRFIKFYVILKPKKIGLLFHDVNIFLIFFANQRASDGFNRVYKHLCALFTSLNANTYRKITEILPKNPKKTPKNSKTKKLSSKCAVVSPIGVKINQPIYTDRHV